MVRLTRVTRPVDRGELRSNAVPYSGRGHIMKGGREQGTLVTHDQTLNVNAAFKRIAEEAGQIIKM